MKALLFLNGTYDEEHTNFYRKEINSNKKAKIIAVDGGANFLQKIKVNPDVIIGDFDSFSKKDAKKICKKIIEYSKEKDFTDSELAIEYCINQGFDEIIIYGAISHELDHVLGNIFMMHQAKKKAIPIQMRDHCQEIHLIKDETLMIKGKAGNIVSIIPLSPIATLIYTGLKYPMKSAKALFGTNKTLRNIMTSNMATITIKGTAVIVHTKAC